MACTTLQFPSTLCNDYFHASCRSCQRIRRGKIESQTPFSHIANPGIISSPPASIKPQTPLSHIAYPGIITSPLLNHKRSSGETSRSRVFHETFYPESISRASSVMSNLYPSFSAVVLASVSIELKHPSRVPLCLVVCLGRLDDGDRNLYGLLRVGRFAAIYIQIY